MMVNNEKYYFPEELYFTVKSIEVEEFNRNGLKSDIFPTHLTFFDTILDAIIYFHNKHYGVIDYPLSIYSVDATTIDFIAPCWDYYLIPKKQIKKIKNKYMFCMIP